MDGCGVGALPDAADYGDDDAASSTLAHVSEAMGGLRAPNLSAMGLGRVTGLAGVSAAVRPSGALE